jgi:hypothetical protein
VSLAAIPINVAVDDFNGDGKADLAAGHSTPTMVSVLLGKGDGTFQAAVTYPTVQNPTSLVSADINGDGGLDLVFSDGPTIGTLNGRGDGTFQAPVSQAVPNRFFSQLIPADFNGDGRTDLETSSYVLLGTTTTITPTAGTPQSTAIGTQFPIPLQVTVRNSGAPVSGATVTYAAPIGGASAVLFTSTATTDASGVASVTATANTQSGTYSVTATYQGVSATFQLTNTNGPPTNLAIVGGTPQIAALGAPFPNALAVRLTDLSNSPVNGATITFAAPASGPTAALSSTTVTTDINGYASVRATAGTTVGAYTVTATFGSLSAARFSLTNLIGDSAALVASANPSVFGAAVTLTATVTPADVTGRLTFYDGATILGSKAVSNGTASISTTLLGTGNRRLMALYSGDASHLIATATATQTVKTTAAVGFRASQISVGAIAPTAVVAGDFNNDGKTDFAMSGNPEGFVSVLLGNGDGTFQTPVIYPVAFNPETIAAGDFNGDGNTDLIVTGVEGNLVFSVLQGNGDGTFRAAVNSPAGMSGGALFVADANGDGKPDLLSVGSGVSFFPGIGDGTFGPSTSTTLTGGFFSVAGVADFNGDGVADLALVTSNSLPVVAIGNGDGTFGPTFAIGTAISAFPSIATGDLNGDGKPDIVIGAGSVQTVYLGRGDGTFLPGVNYSASGTPVIADFNGDGIADFAAVGQTVTLFQGNGDGTFTQSLTYTTSATPFTAFAAELNGDGRADIVAINNASSFNGTATVLLGVAAGLNFNVTYGDKQSAFVQSPFANVLQATVVQDGKPVSGATVTFTAPSSGPSAVLSAGSAVTNAAGQAIITASANSVAGSYAVTAKYQNALVTFSLTNLPAGTITATSGTPQTVLLNSGFQPLQVLVRDATGNPAAGAVVTFTAPSSGATANLSSNGVVTNASGQASVNAVSNAISGSYTVTASVGTASASFQLTNTTVGTVTATRGTPQSTAVSTPFNSPLQVTVLDAAGHPVSNVFVGFRAPTVGASATLSNGAPGSGPLSNGIALPTNASGVATVIATANSIAGTYTVTATVSGTTASTTFSLTNLPSGSPGGINLAQGHTATQSSTLAGYPTDGPGSAVDGNTNGGFFNGSVTATNPDPNAWWQVDLGAAATVNSVVVWNRTDCCASRLSDFWVFVSNTPFLATDTPVTLQSRAGTFASHQTSAPNPSVTIPVAIAGRYVRVQLSGTDYLSLAEVQVFGTGGTPAPANLAVGKAATQSSSFPGSPSASAAVDNNTDGFYFDGSVTATNADTNAWWQVDLGASATINSVVIWNRTDCCGSRLSDYWVFVSDTPFLPTDTPVTLQNRAGTFASHQTSAPNPSTSIPQIPPCVNSVPPCLISVPVIQGRYVRVQLSGTDYLSLAEVQVLGTPVGSTNLAAGKAATQSSIYPGSPGASAAVDGNTDGNFFDGSVTATNADTNAWWQVDLGASASIDSVTIWNRTDCCGTRLGTYWIFVSDTPFAATDTPSTLSTRAGTFAIQQVVGSSPAASVPIGTQGRYVRVQLDGTNYLSLAEVQVFGH